MSGCKSSTNFGEKNLIVIVGAGLAGLSAAYRLIKSGHDNLLILEASDRVGGRVQTCEFPNGARVDLGAQWLHGGHSNPVYKWLDEELDLIEVVEDEEVEFKGLFRHPELCTNKADEMIVARCLEILLEARHVLYEMSSDLIATKCKPLELYRKHLWDESSRCPKLSKARKGLIAATLRWFELYETIDNSCNHMANLSVKAYSEWTDFDNGLMVTLKGGWSSVVDKLTSLIGRDKIKLNSRLVKLILTDHPRILFESCKSKSLNVIDCERIISTVSIGVLKSWILESTFEPPLNEKKANLIQRLGFGVVNKIFVQFQEPFLQEEMGLKLLWSNEDLKSEIFPRWALNLTGFDVCRKQPNILMGWINGPEVECLSEQEVSRVCEMIFAHFLKTEQQVPKIIGVRISSWASDRNFKGSYSYESIDTENDIRDDLWAPLGSGEAPEARLLFFAGEATARKMYSTAHGAIVSGWREADLVLESIGNQ